MEIHLGFDRKPWVFRNPVAELQTRTPEAIPALFAELESALRSGYFVAGFLSYEAGHAFEKILAGDFRPTEFPLVRFGLFRAMEPAPAPPAKPGAVRLESTLPLEFDDYRRNIEKIRNYIQQGDVYQITYCVKNLLRCEGDPRALFWRLLRLQPVPYPAYFLSEEYALLSLSPELLFRKTGTDILTKPMKGTWKRGANVFTDWLNRRKLHHDAKNRAENVMIADLMRNDLGRIGDQVRVPRLFEVASYTTLHQMTSTVTAQVPREILVLDLLRALFPSGSVTGAPKIRAMQIISEIEDGPRRIHTGSIGYITPAREMFFNVAIRTLLLRDGAGEMGVGGGIIWDSTPESEYEECRIKSAFLGGLRTASGIERRFHKTTGYQ